MDFRKRYKLSLYTLIPFIFIGFTFLSFFVAYTLGGQASKTLGKERTIAFLLATIAAAGVLGYLITRLVLRPMEKFLKETGSPSRKAEKAAARKVLLEKDEIDTFEEYAFKGIDALPIAEKRRLFPEMTGESLALRAVLKKCALVAPTDTTVLVTGESGTGKELLASALHRLSNRKAGPFVTVNCVAIPEGLLESELFGHEKGAFTGAVSQRKGKFEASRGGTLFLDEIGDMPLATQAKILRVVQERAFERVGGNTILQADVRIIAATNQDLAKKVMEGTFREDLYHRVKVFDIEMPPLRKRLEDISSLARYFIENQREKKEKIAELSSTAESALLSYDWPGNIRELKNVVERALVLAGGDFITPEHFPPEVRNHGMLAHIIAKESPLDEKLAEIEKRIILDALKKTAGVQAKAAILLGINQRSLWYRVKKYGIDLSELNV